ncbi:MAG: helix-turn-helix domain-containing protein [Patescibacteria group bacterium]
MKTIGQFLKEARMNKSYSKAHLEGKTKIRIEFLTAIEEEDWVKLPEFPVVRGFVKSIADALETNSDQALAFLRRDYPPQKLAVSPKPDVSNKFVWTPRLTFLTAAAGVLLLILGYLTMQYVNFISPPKLQVDTPIESQLIQVANLEVSGKTDPGATIKINNQPTLVDDKGVFKTEIEVNEQTTKVEVVAKSRNNKTTIITRSIQVKLTD